MITQEEARQLFGPQPEPEPYPTSTTLPPNAFYITLPGINETENLDLLDDMPPLLPPTLEPFGPFEFAYSATCTVKEKPSRHSDSSIHAFLQKDNLYQETFVWGSGGEQKPSQP